MDEEAPLVREIEGEDEDTIHDDDDDDDLAPENPLEQENETNLIGDHSYLGSMEEVRGRTMLEEGTIVEIPVIVQAGLISVPGQTLPLFVSHPHIVTMLRRVIEGNHIFGIISPGMISSDEPLRFPMGATAEIYEYGEQTEGGDEEQDLGFRVKARVRQRFKLINARRQLDGILVASVRILPEVQLQDSLYDCRSLSLDKHRLDPGPLGSSIVRAFRSQKRLYEKQYQIPYSVWPSWVSRLYDLELLAYRVRQELVQSVFLKLNSSSSGTVHIPPDPVDLSYWVVQNLPLEDDQRLQLLNINNANQRLRAELSILQRCEHLCCRECDHAVARKEDVFAMSEEGPQSAYVNPYGHVHETLTVHHAEGLRVTTPPTSEFSWFPGYAWSIVECSYCRNHMGWLFTANQRHLRPAEFWGLCRTSLKPRLKQVEADEAVDAGGGFRMVM